MEAAPPVSPGRIESDRRAWNLKLLLACNLGAGLMLLSWVWAPTRELWDVLDVATFHALNGTLDGPRWWQVLVAASNNRKFDLVSFSLTLIIFTLFATERNRRNLVRRSAAAVMVMLYILAVRKVVGLDIFQILRESPTRVLDGAILISDQVPWIDAKDESGQSFPGDHTLFLMMVNAFFWYYGGRRFGIVFLFMTVIFSLPRLIGGAHWLTDDLVGGGFILLVAMSWLLSTPLKDWLLRWFEPPARKVLGRFEPPASAE